MNSKVGVIIIILFLALAIIVHVRPKPALSEEELFALESEQELLPYLDRIANNLIGGGPKKDGIPAIDNPKYVSAADALVDDDEIVFGIDYNGIVKAFPSSIMYWHEIVNDEINGDKISVTFCPLTGSGIGFKGKNLGVSGKLYNSNLVLYDRETDSEIPQILNYGVTGPLKAQRLEEFHVYKATWKKWKTKYPNTLVLSRDTGHPRDYDRNPYPGYDDILRVWFPLAAKSDQFKSKKIVVGVEHNGEFLAIPKEEFSEVGTDIYTLGGDELTLVYDVELDVIKAYLGPVKEENLINSFELFWFAWYAFHPTTQVWGS